MSDVSTNEKTSVRRRVAVGDIAPDFALANAATGETVRLSDLRGQDVLLLFFRGTWCPHCRDQMRLLAASYERLAGGGIVPLGVLCQSQEGVKRYLDTNPLPFPLLPDESRQVARAYGVHYWLTYEGFNLAHPALFILDRQGTVTFAHIGRNMSDLPVGDILDKFLQFLSESK